jgi:23S rRNA (guanine745-N1)-methyltransferase
MDTIFHCPVCQVPLVREDRRWVCANQHAFDAAREGYVNLLLANQKRSREPGDNAAMVKNRRAFLNAGYYDPLRDKLIEIFAAFVEIEDNRDLSVLDVGCGEGFYTSGLQQHFDPQPLRFYGIDISKFAIRAASRRYQAILFAVAGSRQLPILDRRVDFLLSIFAPRAFDEFSRVLVTGGKLVMVTPGPAHLWGLRQLLYDDPRSHAADGPMPVEFALQYETTLGYEIAFSSHEAIGQLLAMTPYIWRAPEHKQQAILQQTSLQTPVEFVVRVFSLRDI